MNETLDRIWPVVLTAVMALLYAWIGLAAHGWDQILGAAGGLVILVALAVARWSRAVALVLLVAGALPLAMVTWWSIVTPVLAILALVLGWFAVRNLDGHRPAPALLTTVPAGP
jgi:hypothetical protein